MGNAHAMKPLPSTEEVKESASRSSSSKGSRRRQSLDTESLATTILLKRRQLSMGNNHAQKPLPPLLCSPDEMNADELAFAVLEKIEGLPELDIALAKDDNTEHTEITQEMTEASGRLSTHSTDRNSRASSTRNNKSVRSNYKQEQSRVLSPEQKAIEHYISKMDSAQVLRKLERMAKTDADAKDLLRAVRNNGEIAF